MFLPVIHFSNCGAYFYAHSAQCTSECLFLGYKCPVVPTNAVTGYGGEQKYSSENILKTNNCQGRCIYKWIDKYVCS